MPTNRTKRTRASNGLDYWKIDQLVTGQFLMAGTGYGQGLPNGCNLWTDADWQTVRDRMRADWQQYRTEFLAWWRGETERFTAVYASINGAARRQPAVIPWAETQFNGEDHDA